MFIQKGYKITGRAWVLKSGDKGYGEMHRKLSAAIGMVFSIVSLIEIEPIAVDGIIAPSYRMFPGKGPIDRSRDSSASYHEDGDQGRYRQAGTGNVALRLT